MDRIDYETYDTMERENSAPPVEKVATSVWNSLVPLWLFLIYEEKTYFKDWMNEFQSKKPKPQCGNLACWLVTKNIDVSTLNISTTNIHQVNFLPKSGTLENQPNKTQLKPA